MQWYTRIPARNPAMKITAAVLATAIPTAVLILRDSIVPEVGVKYIWCMYNVVSYCQLKVGQNKENSQGYHVSAGNMQHIKDCGAQWLLGSYSSMVKLLAAEAGQRLPVFHFPVIHFITKNEAACVLETYQKLRILEQL